MARPSRETKRGSRVVAVDATEATPGMRLASRVSAATSDRTASERTEASGRSSTIALSPERSPVAASRRSTAWAESESRSVKPPLASSSPATGPPTAAAKTVNNAATTRTRRGREEMRLASAESMAATSIQKLTTVNVQTVHVHMSSQSVGWHRDHSRDSRA